MPRITPRSSFIGIDPGSTGGITVIAPSRVDVYRMPRGERELWNLLNRLLRGREAVVTVEKVQAYAKQGARGMFTFGRGYGAIVACCYAGGVEPDEVRPQVWQKALGIPSRLPSIKVNGKKKEQETTTAWKTKLMNLARSLYPDLDCWDWKKLEDRRGVSDSILIAEYARRKHLGDLTCLR